MTNTSHQTLTLNAVVFVDRSWGSVTMEELGADFLEPLEASRYVKRIFTGGAVGAFRGQGNGAVKFVSGVDERDLVLEAGREDGCDGVLRLTLWGKYRLPLTNTLIENTVNGYCDKTPGGWLQTDLSDLPFPFLKLEILGPDTLAALQSDACLPMDWEFGKAHLIDLAMARRTLSNPERQELLGARSLTYFSFPKFLALESTRLCNLRCTICVTHSDFIDHSHLDRYPKHFDFEKFKWIVDQLVSFKDYVSIAPQFQGEPFLAPALMDMVGYAKGKGMSVGFTSNATLWDDDAIQTMIDLGINNLKVSIDGASEETYEGVRIGADFDQVVGNVETLLDRRGKQNGDDNKPYVALSMTVLADNRHEKEAFLDYWLPRADSVTFNNVCLNDVVAEKFFEPERYPCPYLWEGMHILTNGDVVPCCRDNKYEEVMGNAYDTPVLNIWNGEKYRRFRDLHVEGRWDEIDICSRCDTWMAKTNDVRREGESMVRVFPFNEEYRPVPAKIVRSPAGRIAGVVRRILRKVKKLVFPS